MLINIGDVVDGALVSAIAVAGRRISVAVDGLRGRRRVSDLTAAGHGGSAGYGLGWNRDNAEDRTGPGQCHGR
jgi:hypothetical protein